MLKVLDADITTATPIYVTWEYSTWTRRGVVCNVDGKGEPCKLTYEGRCVFWEGGGGNGCWRATAKLLIPPADTPCGTDDGLC